MAFVTDSNRPQPIWQPPPTACLIATCLWCLFPPTDSNRPQPIWQPPPTACLTASCLWCLFPPTDSNRPQPIWQPPPTACLTASYLWGPFPPNASLPPPPPSGAGWCLLSRPPPLHRRPGLPLCTSPQMSPVTSTRSTRHRSSRTASSSCWSGAPPPKWPAASKWAKVRLRGGLSLTPSGGARRRICAPRSTRRDSGRARASFVPTPPPPPARPYASSAPDPPCGKPTKMPPLSPPPPPRVTFRRVVVSLRGPGRSPVILK